MRIQSMTETSSRVEGSARLTSRQQSDNVNEYSKTMLFASAAFSLFSVQSGLLHINP